MILVTGCFSFHDKASAGLQDLDWVSMEIERVSRLYGFLMVVAGQESGHELGDMAGCSFSVSLFYCATT